MSERPTRANRKEEVRREMARAFGAVLRRRRTASGLTQDWLAEQAHLTGTYVAMLERGERSPTLLTTFDLAAGLGVAAVDLVADTDKELRGRAPE